MLNILVVDDDLTILQAVAAMLRYLKHEVWAVNNAKDALAILRRGPHSIDLMIADLVMKGLSGFELAREIRAERPSLPIIIMSGYVNPQSTGAVETLRELGITQVLTKPMDRQNLDAAIQATLGRQRQ